MYTVTRQLRTDGFMVEVSLVIGGDECHNPDLLEARYLGEAATYLDPRNAAKMAIKIMGMWQADEPDQKIEIGYGDSPDAPIPLKPCTVSDIDRWSRRKFARMPRCDWCSDPIFERAVKHTAYSDAVFCSENCAIEYASEYSEGILYGSERGEVRL